MTSPAYRAAADRHGTRHRQAGFEVRLLPARPPPKAGFGCPDPNVLPVQRRGENEIAFPGCTDFPFPLIRCGTH